MHLNEGPALARALERLPRCLRELTLSSLDGMRTSVPLGMQLQDLTQVTSLTLSSRWGCESHGLISCPGFPAMIGPIHTLRAFLTG